MSRVLLFCGAAAVGKTSVIKHLVENMKLHEKKVSACKIDCLHTDDGEVYEKLNIDYKIGLSKDICPDHYLVSNIQELIQWSNNNNSDYLIIETAGLCNRCSPATKNTTSIYVLDATISFNGVKKLGPMLTTADVIVLTKLDMISQAEKEVIKYNLKTINKKALIITIDGLYGNGISNLINYIKNLKELDNYEEDELRHSMPSAVCSYCVGEMRIGNCYQQGVVEKIII